MKRKQKHLTFFILFMFIFTTFMPITCLAWGPSSEQISQGIDVSSWQGNINFSAVKNSGIDIVYIKSSEGSTYVDPYLEANYSNAKANGLKVGFYHYVTARNVQQAESQAYFFAKVISGKSPDCKLAMDFESFGNLSINEINQISKRFLETLENATKLKAIIYSNSYSAKNIFSGELAKYPLWVANYGVSKPGGNDKWNSWVGWQYTSTGVVNGISGYVDRNQFTDGVLLSSVSPIPEPSTPEIPDTGTDNTTVYTVRKGDTLSHIALWYHTTVSELVNLNGIKNPNLIYPGQRILISNSSGQDLCGQNSCGKILYKIHYGDTLSEIAQTFRCTVNEIAKLNNIANPNLIYAGSVIRIPNCR